MGRVRVLVSEFLCGGAWPEAELPKSLVREGRAMIEALVEDLVSLEDVEVSTSWDARLAPPRFASSARVACQVVETAEEEANWLRQAAADADMVLAIAPELNDCLAVRVQTLAESGTQVLNASPAAVRLCSDKLLLSEFCDREAIPTIETCPLSAVSSLPWPRTVVKRRDGAGSMEMQRVDSQAGWDEFRRNHNEQHLIAQPEISGRTLSVAAIFHHGRCRSVWPTTEQCLSTDGRFSYLGGRIPATGVDQDLVAAFVRRVGERVGGLHGYLGFDLLQAVDHRDELILVEINPRLTTSYLGYRAISEECLAAWLRDPGRADAPTFQGSVSFQADGEVTERCR